MADRAGFQGKLSGILAMAEENGGRLSVEETEKYFEDDHLSEEQLELVFDYLLSQKIVIPGYERRPGCIREEERADDLNEEERRYLEEYRRQIAEMKEDSGEDGLAGRLAFVVEEALKMHRQEVFLGDLIQEGNAALVEAMASGDEASAEDLVRGAMRALLETQIEVKKRDRRMVSQVEQLDAAIQSMSKELGRKVDVEEVAAKMGISEEQIEDILKLAGEEMKEEQ